MRLPPVTATRRGSVASSVPSGVFRSTIFAGSGGPHYLLRFASERTLTINTTAAGGNASLLTLDD